MQLLSMRRFIAQVRLREDLLREDGAVSLPKGTPAFHAYFIRDAHTSPAELEELAFQQAFTHYHRGAEYISQEPKFREQMEVVLQELPEETAVTLQTIEDLPVDGERALDESDMKSLLNKFLCELTFRSWDRTRDEMDLEDSPFVFKPRKLPPEFRELEVTTLHWRTPQGSRRSLAPPPAKLFAVVVEGGHLQHERFPDVYVVDTDLAFKAAGEILIRVLRMYEDEDVQKLRPGLNEPLPRFDLERLSRALVDKVDIQRAKL